MTVVNPKSISGITSITTASGSDDILTIHNNNGTERLRIDSTGTTKITTGIVTTLTATSSAKVGSGVTLSSDGDVFATGVCTATTFSGAFSGDGSALTGVANTDVIFTDKITLPDSAAGSINVGLSSDIQIYHSSGQSYIQNSTGNFRIDADALRLRSKTGGEAFISANVNGAVELYHDDTKQCETSASGLAFPSGKGIDFSAVASGSGMTSELLDDYEEGTFSPIPDAGGGVTFTYAHNKGFYTKIGNTVTFQIYLMFYASSITGGNSGNGVAIQGLPYTIKNNDRYNPAFTIGRTYNFDIDSDQRIYAYGDSNSTNIRMIIQTDDSTGSILTAGQVDQSTCLTFISGTYQT